MKLLRILFSAAPAGAATWLYLLWRAATDERDEALAELVIARETSERLQIGVATWMEIADSRRDEMGPIRRALEEARAELTDATGVERALRAALLEVHTALTVGDSSAAMRAVAVAAEIQQTAWAGRQAMVEGQLATAKAERGRLADQLARSTQWAALQEQRGDALHVLVAVAADAGCFDSSAVRAARADVARVEESIRSFRAEAARAERVAADFGGSHAALVNAEMAKAGA